MKKTVLIFVTLSIAASALNYIVYPLFGRVLSSSEYINITVALSLFTQVSAFLSSITAITIGLSKGEHSKQINEKIELLQAFLFKLFLVLAAIFLVISPIVMGSVHTPILFAIPIALMMLLSIPIQVISGYLNGKNQMIKLGLTTLISAGSQFVIGLSTSLISHNGLITMLSMTIAQIVTIIIIYKVFSKDDLPGITASLKMPLSTIKNSRMGKLILFTVLTSLAIMIISLVQIADLFIIQSLNHSDVKSYTDIYVISRVVFFAGMIFIWPFLGEINIDNHRFNRKPFIKLIGVITAITLAAMTILFFFGDLLTNVLFGSNYSLELIRNIGILSVLYKYLLLIITAAVLYFVVLRNYTAVWLALIACVAIITFSQIVGSHSNISTILTGLDIIAAVLALISVVLLIRIPVRK